MRRQGKQTPDAQDAGEDRGGVVEVPGQGGVVRGESSYIRERARAMGMSMQELAEQVGMSPSYLSQVSR